MAARLSAKKLPRYSLAVKRKAVKLTQSPGMQVQVVAKALGLHPVMLSRWRQEAPEGQLRGASEQVKRAPKAPVRELKRLRAGAGARAASGGARVPRPPSQPTEIAMTQYEGARGK